MRSQRTRPSDPRGCQGAAVCGGASRWKQQCPAFARSIASAGAERGSTPACAAPTLRTVQHATASRARQCDSPVSWTLFRRPRQRVNWRRETDERHSRTTSGLLN